MIATGRVSWFKLDKKFGFVALEDGDGDAFLHVSVLKAAGYVSIPAGTRLQVRLEQERGRLRVGRGASGRYLDGAGGGACASASEGEWASPVRTSTEVHLVDPTPCGRPQAQRARSPQIARARGSSPSQPCRKGAWSCKPPDWTTEIDHGERSAAQQPREEKAETGEAEAFGNFPVRRAVRSSASHIREAEVKQDGRSSNQPRRASRHGRATGNRDPTAARRGRKRSGGVARASERAGDFAARGARRYMARGRGKGALPARPVRRVARGGRSTPADAHLSRARGLRPAPSRVTPSRRQSSLRGRAGTRYGPFGAPL